MPAARAGWVPSSGNIKARSLEPLPSRTMIVPDRIQILDPQLQTSLIRMPVPYRRRTNDARPENRGCEPTGVSTTGKRRDGRGLPISEARADPYSTAP